jgi:hypothetical protein
MPSDPEVGRAIASLDLDDVRARYWRQDEFVFLPRVLPPALVERLVGAVERVRRLVHRTYIPRHKQGGSVSHYALLEHAPEIVALYRAPEFIRFVGDVVQAPVGPCPESDPHACALYFYTEPGDHIGFHYDTSYYKGARYTILVGLIERSSSRLLCRLYERDPGRRTEELTLATEPGSVVIFNGDKLYHAISPLGAGEQRVSLTLEYVTNAEMGPVKRIISDLKDAVGYFGFAELLRGRRRQRVR